MRHVLLKIGVYAPWVIFGSFCMLPVLIAMGRSPPFVMVAVLLAIVFAVVFRIRRKEPIEQDVESENAYIVLGVSRKADGAAIEEAYQALSRLYEASGEKERMLRRLQQAHALLSGEESRFRYDCILEEEKDLPKLEDAYLRFKDEDRHWLYEEYEKENPEEGEPE